jgi:peptidoglycan hydrolase CwlO-like protein
MISYGIIAILIAILITMYIGIKNLIIQAEYLEEKVEFYEKTFEEIRKKVLDTETKLRELDIRGSFESDDEVGFVFKEIKELSSDLTKTVQTIYESNN